jgi:hypothetical protein
MYGRPAEQFIRTWTRGPGFEQIWPHQIAAAPDPTTLPAVVEGADPGGRGGVLAGVLGQQLPHPRQMGP